ncbi:hypothetical protein BX666DRAFT_2025231 [Dichotomocladium elegans]|nr:hypothetical protein BX666DRAFT_2025231 [Dichotomocladium elegans]
MTSTSRAKKQVEYFFIDMNDPNRYKKLKVSQACDFCRRRKSKCDIGIPGSGSCSNCRKAGIVCIFANQPPPCDKLKSQLTFSSAQDLVQWIYTLFPLLDINANPHFNLQDTSYVHYHQIQSLDTLEQELLSIYFSDIHPYYPILTAGTPLTPSLRSAVLAVACAIALPDMATLSSVFAGQAHSSLGNGDGLETAQTLLLLCKYQEMTCPSQEKSPYFDRIRLIVDSLPKNNLEVLRAKWILYLNVSWSGSTEHEAIWKQWCNERDTYELLDMEPGFAAFARITLSYFNHHHHSPVLPSSQQHQISLPPSQLHQTHHQHHRHQHPQHQHNHHQHYQADGPFYPYVCLINDMMLLSTQQVQMVDRLEQQVRNVAGTIAQRASIQGSRILTTALKLGLYTYICYYASASTFSPSTDIMDWTHVRLSLIMQLFQAVGVHPNLSTSVQHLINLLYQGCFHLDYQTPATAGVVY